MGKLTAWLPAAFGGFWRFKGSLKFALGNAGAVGWWKLADEILGAGAAPWSSQHG